MFLHICFPGTLKIAKLKYLHLTKLILSLKGTQETESSEIYFTSVGHLPLEITSILFSL